MMPLLLVRRQRPRILILATSLLVVGLLCSQSWYHSRAIGFSKFSEYSLKEHPVMLLNDETAKDTDTPNDDPSKALRRRFVRDQTSQSNNSRFLVNHLSHVLTLDSICAFGPGQGIEEEAGYKLLVEKIRRVPGTATPRLFCGIYSYSGKQGQIQVQAATWGYLCDGWMVFSNETLAEWGIYDLPHAGPESYGNMWQKVRSLWTYVYDKFHLDYDYFYVAGDDTYLLVDNLKDFLQQVDDNDQHSKTVIPARFMGQWLPGKQMIAGGPGYVLNAVALRRLVEEALPQCFVTTTASYEDRLVSKCLAQLGILGNETDTRDSQGEQCFHDASPSSLYTFRSSRSVGGGSSYLARTASTWEDLVHPSRPNQTVGPKHGLAAAATHSISFHNLYTPHYMARVHAILYPNYCPPDSPLGRGLRQHLPPNYFQN